jgi:ABC-type transport system involved in multi-copper enzyme maturation permease subunit
MMQTILVSSLICLVQFLAALPWLRAIDAAGFWRQARKPLSWLIAVVGVLIAGGLLALFLNLFGDAERLQVVGQFYCAVLQLQLTVDFFLFFFPAITWVWPKGTAVALAAFREGVRQPMFWLLASIALGAMAISPFLPYFTFGEDVKMVRELGYDTIMLFPVLFSVLAASTSISDEIEGRTAITVMSKPVSRREFLLGKFIGTLFAALFMTMILAWAFNGVTWFKLWFDRETIPDPIWLEPLRQAWSAKLGVNPVNFVLGAMIWLEHTLQMIPGVLLGFCQTMVLLAIAVALATRLPMVVNIVTCLLVFFLGHLTTVLVHISAGKYALINFMAKFFDNVLPGLEYFDFGTILARDQPFDHGPYFTYLGSVFLYAALYSVIALLFGLILFEDRDLA